MRKYSLFLVLGLCLILFNLPAVAKSQGNHGDRVCVYTDEHFHGHEQCFTPGEEVADLKHADLASIKVYGRARAVLYEERDFGGRMMDFTADIPNLHRLQMSDGKSWHHVGSLRVTSDVAPMPPLSSNSATSGYISPQGYPVPQFIAEGVCVYDRPNYQGRFQCWTADTDIANLDVAKWNDKIASVRVFGDSRLVAYKDPEFRGERIIIDHDVADLSDYPMHTGKNWHHEISSFQIEGLGR